MGEGSKAKESYTKAREIYSESTDYERKEESIRKIDHLLEKLQESIKRK
jgi:hypothetical protein